MANATDATTEDVPIQAAAPPAPREVVTNGSATFFLSVGHPCVGTGRLGGCSAMVLYRGAELSVPEGNVTRSFVIATWTPTTPLATRLHVFLETPAPEGQPVGTNVAYAAGTSPLTIEIDPSDLALTPTLVGRAVADTPGLVVQQRVDLELHTVVASLPGEGSAAVPGASG